MKRVAVIAATIFATLSVALLLWEFRGVAGLFVISLIVAAMARAPIDLLMRRHVARGWATFIVYGLSISLVVAAIIFLGPILIRQLPALAAELSQWYAAQRAAWSYGNTVQQVMAQQLPTPEQLGLFLFNAEAGNPLDGLVGVTQNVLSWVGQAILVVVLSIYWSMDRVYFERLWLSLLPPEQRIHARNIAQALERGVGAYARSEILQSVLAGTLLAAGFWLIGVKYPLSLALIAAAAWLIPLVGALIALLPTLLIGSLSGPLVAVLAAGYMLIIFALMEFGVEPRLARRRRSGLIMALLVTIALVDAFGLMGLLAAPPLAMAIKILVDELLRPAEAKVDTLEDYVESLLKRMALLGEKMNGDDMTPPPHIVNLYQRLVQLLEKVEAFHTS